MYVRAAALSEPLPHYSLFCGQSIIDPILATFGQICNFSRSQIRHSLFLWIDPFFRIQNTSLFIYSSGMFANRKYEELSYLKKSENVRPHSSNSIENATLL